MADDTHLKCFKCDGRFDLVDVVALVATGQSSSVAQASDWEKIRAECERRGWVRDVPTAARAPHGLLTATEALVGKRYPRPPVPDAAEPPPVGGRFAWSAGLADECAARLYSDEGGVVLRYLRDTRKLTDETIRHWGLGAYPVRIGDRVSTWWATIPLVDHHETTVNLRFRVVPGWCGGCGGTGCDECKTSKYRVCHGRPLPLFGVQNLGSDLGAPVLVTEGEFDVIALWQYGYRTSVVSGTAGAGSLKDEWLDQLEPYQRIVLAYDDDEKGNEGAQKIAKALDPSRCDRMVLPRKDAGDCLAAGLPRDAIDKALHKAKSCSDVAIYGALHYADAIESMVNAPEDLRGRPTGSQRLDHALGGIRPGLIVVTGETGQGKTSFTTWLLWQQAMMGVPSLLTSFEQSPRGTVAKLLRMQMGGDWSKNTTLEQRYAALMELEQRPLRIVDHRGNMGFAAVERHIEYGVRRLGIKNVLIDHLGFVTNPDAEDERREIENIVRKLSVLAEHSGVAMFLICHPSNQHVVQKRRVGLADLKGASAIRQDAHEVWVVEAAPMSSKRNFPASYIHLDKIRSDFGQSGATIQLAYDPISIVYADTWAETPSGRAGRSVVVAQKGHDDEEDLAAPRLKRARPSKDKPGE
ncbi:MAG: toprim domain-containing protein [Chloroflexi bacterium]|nr:toprim domain-containing protein [Chloroflexota bacterium]